MIALYSVFTGIALWQIAYDALAATFLFKALSINLFLASPIQVVKTFRTLLASGELLQDSYFSLLEFVYGYVLAVVIGIPIGALMATHKKINYYLDPWVSLIYATPRIALAPIIMIWFGLGIVPNSLVVFLGALFPILLNTYTGIISVKRNLVELGKAFGGSPLQIFRKIMIPAALPAIITGLRLAVGRAVISVVVAEWFGAEAGLGYMVYTYAQLFQPGPVFVGIVVLVAFGYITFVILEQLQGWVCPWYQMQARAQAGGMEME